MRYRATSKASPFERVITNLLERKGLLLKFCLTHSFRALYSVEGYGSLVIERQGWNILVRLEQEDGGSSVGVGFCYPSWMSMSITLDSSTRQRYSDHNGKLVIDKHFDKYADPFLEKWAQEIEVLGLNEDLAEEKAEVQQSGR